MDLGPRTRLVAFFVVFGLTGGARADCAESVRWSGDAGLIQVMQDALAEALSAWSVQNDELIGASH